MLVFQKNDHIIAIELKLSDWKKALVQAQNYQLAADLVYIAFPLVKCELVVKRAKETLETKGIGLLAVDEKTKQVSIVLPAKKSRIMFGRLTKQEIIKQKRKRKRKRL